MKNLKKLSLPKELLDIAFRKARKEAWKIRKLRDSFKLVKTREIRKVEVVGNYLSDSLNARVKAVPTLNELDPFYRDLVEATVDVPSLKKALGQMSSTAKIIAKLKRQFISDLKKAREQKQVLELSKKFYGRASSVVKSLQKSVEAYNKVAESLRELPSIDFSLSTIVLAGCPNTGKTTILKRLTKSAPKIASYPFTTKGIKIGYFEYNHRKIQVIDTPGLLDRPMEKRNKIEKKAISALKHLGNVVVFVLGVTANCGFSIEEQLNLLKEVESEFKGKKILVVLNKKDIASKKEIDAVKQKIGKKFELVAEGEKIKSKLKEKILGKLGLG